MNRVSKSALHAVVLRVVETRSRCPACGKRPEIFNDGGDWYDRHIRLTALCHGSTSYFVSELDRAIVGPQRIVAELAAWMRGLFVLDAFPDMLELLAYNRGALPGAGA